MSDRTTTTHLKHKRQLHLPRHLRSHTHLATLTEQSTDDVYPSSYPACCITGSKTASPLAIDAQKPVNIEKMLAERESICETWITNYANSVNQQRYVTNALVVQTFAPQGKENVRSIFARYAGSTQ